MRLESKLSASEAYGRGTCQGIHVMQTLARYQLLTTANAKQRRPLIMLETMVTPLATLGSLGIRLNIAMNGRYRGVPYQDTSAASEISTRGNANRGFDIMPALTRRQRTEFKCSFCRT